MSIQHREPGAEAQALPETHRVFGTYQDKNGGQIVVSLKNDALYIGARPLGSGPQELYPESNTDFFGLSNDTAFTFQKDEKGNVSKLVARHVMPSFPLQPAS